MTAGEIIIREADLSPAALVELRPCAKEFREGILIFDFGSPCYRRRAAQHGIAVLREVVHNRESNGPGTLVKLVLDELGIKPRSGCGCAEFARKMNAWSWAGCLTHRAEIKAWFSARAAEQNLSVTPALIARALGAAWRVARRKT